MDRERAKELLPIIEAYANGKDIEIREGLNNWIATDSADWKNYIQYRIKPEPKEWWLCWESFQSAHEKMAYPCDLYSESDVNHWGNYAKVREVL